MKTTKSAFAQQAGLKAQTLQNYVNGRDPSADSLLKIHDQYGVDLNWLVCGEGKPFLAYKIGVRGLTRAISEGGFLEHFREVLPQLRQGALIRYETEDGRNSIGTVIEFVTGDFQFVYCDTANSDAPEVRKEFLAIKKVASIFGIPWRQVSAEWTEIEEIKTLYHPGRFGEILARAEDWLEEEELLESILVEDRVSKELLETVVLLKEHASSNLLKSIRMKLLEIREVEGKNLGKG